jgi:hypothetical protein
MTRVHSSVFLLTIFQLLICSFQPSNVLSQQHSPEHQNSDSSKRGHRRPLRLGKKTKHNFLRSEIKNFDAINLKAGTGSYKDLLEQNIELDPSVMIIDPVTDRGNRPNNTNKPWNITLKLHDIAANDTHPPSVLKFDHVTEPGKFSILSMVVEHHSDTRWMVPSFHWQHSAGWNRCNYTNSSTMLSFTDSFSPPCILSTERASLGSTCDHCLAISDFSQ